MLRQFGLIGYPLSHSFSKGYFAEKFSREGIADAVYNNYPLSSISAFTALCEQHPNLCGLNVTIPYKEAVIPYLDELSEEARLIGAVNTIVLSGGKKVGYNTDAYGFEQSLRLLLRPHHTHALVLGTGGASKAVVYVLDKLNITWQYVTRKPSDRMLGYASLSAEMVNAHPLIINTTPLGMYPDTGSAPDIPYVGIGKGHLLYDLIYNPSVTRFMQQGIDRGATVINGLEMLHLQAERAWQIWNVPAS